MPISLFQFANTAPANGTINVLFSQSINSSPDAAGYAHSSSNNTIQAINVPFESDNGVNVQESLQQLDKITLNLKNGHEGATKIEATIKNKTRKSGYFFLQLDEVNFLDDSEDNVSASYLESFMGDTLQVSSSYGRKVSDPLNIGSFAEIPTAQSDEAVLLNPFIVGSFTNTDFEPLISNATEVKETTHRFKVDRFEDQANPKNLTAILNRNAERAEVQDSNYEDTGIINARYAGTKLTGNDIAGNEPLQSFLRFDGSQHDDGADDNTIKNISAQERTIEQFFFNVTSSLVQENSETNTFFYSRIPQVDNYLYKFDNESRRYQRVPESKIFILDTAQVVTTNDEGLITSRSAVLT